MIHLSFGETGELLGSGEADGGDFMHFDYIADDCRVQARFENSPP
jgi:hypothetical protein